MPEPKPLPAKDDRAGWEKWIPRCIAVRERAGADESHKQSIAICFSEATENSNFKFTLGGK